MTLNVAVFPPFVATNPYQRLLHEELNARGVSLEAPTGLSVDWMKRAQREVDAIHLHWLEYIIWSSQAQPRRWLADHGRALALAGLGHALPRWRPLVWTAHNLRAHEPRHPRLEDFVTYNVARGASAVVVHSHHAGRQVSARFRRSEGVWVLPHGNYIGAYPEPRRSREEVRDELGLAQDAFLYLAFGEIRPFKRVPEVIRTFRGLRQQDAQLLVYGKPRFAGDRHELVAAAEGDARVVTRLEWIPEERVTEILEAADALVINYEEIFSSGTLLLALSYGVPVVAPSSGAASEAARAPAVELFEPGELAQALLRVQDGDRRERSRAAFAAAAAHTWSIMADGLAALYEGLDPY